MIEWKRKATAVLQNNRSPREWLGKEIPAAPTNQAGDQSSQFGFAARPGRGASPEGLQQEDEWLYPKALQVSQQAGKSSGKFLCRSLQIGPYQAWRLLERMEQEGRLGPADRLGRREVIVKDPPSPVQPQQQGEPGSESDPLFAEAVALVSQQGEDMNVTVLKESSREHQRVAFPKDR